MPNTLEFDGICELLPYRPPMLMIDRVLGWSDDGITVEKRVLATDPVVASHLIHGPHVMPGVLLIELVGQAACLHALLRDDSASVLPGGRRPVRLLGRCKARFVRPALVGSRITADVTHLGSALNGAVHRGRLNVGDDLIAEIEVMSAYTEAPGGLDVSPPGRR